MMKLVFEFKKTGDMIYISHLDLTRLFLRVLRMSDLRPAYSHGFNPHPRMSFALPLPLGILSVCELLEFELDEKQAKNAAQESIDKAVFDVNNRLPEGIFVKAWGVKPERINKSLSSLISAAVYEFMCDGIEDSPEKLESFFMKESVFINKRDKKTCIDKEIDIRDQMLGYRIVKDIRGRMLAEATLSAAPGRTLGPAAFFLSFCRNSGLDAALLSPVITRTAMVDADIKPIYEKLNLRRL